MNSPNIPNLLETLRASRGGRVNGRRGGYGQGNGQHTTQEKKDKVIQQTDDDAAGSRLSAVDAGYLEDEFAEVFWLGGSHDDGVRAVRPKRMPIINRGTYVRTTALDKLACNFLSSHLGHSITLSSPADTVPKIQTTPPNHLRKAQIVSLGAGTDTRFFRLLQRHPELAQQLIYHEIDFPATTQRKIQAIEQNAFVNNMIESAIKRRGGSNVTDLAHSGDGISFTSPLYNIHAIDLRALASSSSTSPSAPIKIPNLDPSAPTLMLSECCLTYLPVGTSSALLQHFVSNLVAKSTPIELLLYEPLHPDDAFGRTMQTNLASRGIDMPGMRELATLEAHQERLRSVGLGSGSKESSAGESSGGLDGWTVKSIWDEWVTDEEKDRLRGCEMVDEEEEWVLLAGHYAVIRAWKS